MPLSLDLFNILSTASPADAWRAVLDQAMAVCSPPLPASEVLKRDRAVADLDLFLATAGWDLWPAFEAAVPRASTELTAWWAAQSGGRAILLLDGLSLREMPWLMEGARARGYTLRCQALGSELPADTDHFAQALGFGRRAALENGGGASQAFAGAHTEATELPWLEAARLVGSEKDWVFWHHWPDHRIHGHDTSGKGLSSLAQELAPQFRDDAFWTFVDRLATGRRLVIASDHGYAASEAFTDIPDREQGEYMKACFASRRFVREAPAPGSWVPPLDLAITTAHGAYRFALGRRKWKSAGGYPTLTHGGLSVLEVIVPYMEIWKSTGGTP